MYNKPYKTMHTYIFTVGFTTAEQAVVILRDVKKIDPGASTTTSPTSGIINGRRVDKTIFQFIAEPSAVKELFFKLKLKYAEFTLGKSLNHTVLTASV